MTKQNLMRENICNDTDDPMDPRSLTPEFMFNRNCQRKDCPNQADWCPLLLLYTLLDSEPIPAFINLAICQEHKHLITLEHMLGPAGWEYISNGIVQAFKTPPVRELTQVRAVRIPQEKFLTT